MQLRVLNLLEKIFDQQALVGKDDNIAFWCPFCKKEEYKKKLIIYLDENSDKFGWWHCWVCEASNDTKGRSLFKLFKKLNVDNKYFYELSKIIRTSYKNIDSFLQNNSIQSISQIQLPDEFIPLIDDQNNPAYSYLMDRDIREEDIIKYNIGYCREGKYKNRVIIPSYDLFGNLNYFIGRSFDKNWFPKYKNSTSKHKEFNIIFEMQINWNMPILIVEGIFDAIAAKRNTIPLLGQSIGQGLLIKLIEEDVNDLIIALDSDAAKTSMKYIEKFISEGINVKFIKMDKHDPSELGFEKFINLYNNASNIDFENLIKLKMRF